MQHGNALQDGGQIVQQRRMVRRLLLEFFHAGEQGVSLSVRDRAQNFKQQLPPLCAQHFFNLFALQFLAAAKGDGLIQQRQPIAHAAVGSARQLRQSAGRGFQFLLLQYLGQQLTNQCGRQAFQIELQAARQHGDR